MDPPSAKVLKEVVGLCGPAAAVVVALACATEDEAAQVNATTALPTVVTVTATDYAFQAPDTIPAGFTTFRLVNRSDQIHMAHLIRLDSERTIQDLIEGYSEAVRTAGSGLESFTEYVESIQWAARFGGPAADPHATSVSVTQHLEPGSYAWICLRDLPDGVLHLTKGMARPLEVRSADDTPVPRIAPEARVVIRMIDYAFILSTPLTVGRQTIRVENAGPEPHALTLLRFEAGKTMSDLQAYLENVQSPPPAVRVGGVTALASALDAYIEVDLTPGDYVLVCFLTAPDGRSHIAHGMIQPVRVG